MLRSAPCARDFIVLDAPPRGRKTAGGDARVQCFITSAGLVRGSRPCSRSNAARPLALATGDENGGPRPVA